MSLVSDHKYRFIGSAPVSEDNPCGENIRYESNFEQLEAELAKQESLNSETVDWRIVANVSSEIIEHASKDLLVGSYLCYALLMTEGYSGFAVGLKVLSEMVEKYWDGLFPPQKRMRARQSSFVWLAEKAGMYLSSKPPSSADSDAVLEAAEAIKTLDNLLVEFMGDQAPMLTEISRPLKNYAQSARVELEKVKQQTTEKPVEAKQESAVESASNEAAGDVDAVSTAVDPSPAPRPIRAEATKPVAQPDTSAGSASIESDSDTRKILRQLQTTLRDVSSFWINAKLSDSRPYRHARIASWIVVETVPPDQDGVTQINPPASERLKYFESLQEKKEFIQLIPEIEKTLSRSPFWLDGHFLVVKYLRQIGDENSDAIKTIIRELAGFLDRLPSVLYLSFSDNTPFANDQTRMWIESEVLTSGSSDTESADSSSETAEEWSVGLKTALQLAASGETDQAINLLNDGIANSSQLRNQFYWRFALANLFLQTGNALAATTILEQIIKQSDNFQLATWEPGLLAKVYNLLFQSYQKQKKLKKDDASFEARLDQVFEQLCWFDPVAALSVKGE
ncbi:MAG: type VI secretion system protein TssA [Gammaproteobacteria bacterium]|nr:type VI secretion system protein TssA [Gammaproteobacteria bacterium]